LKKPKYQQVSYNEQRKNKKLAEFAGEEEKQDEPK